MHLSLIIYILYFRLTSFQSDREDELRTKQLEQEIIEGRKRRQALRAERARSLLSTTADKKSRTLTPPAPAPAPSLSSSSSLSSYQPPSVSGTLLEPVTFSLRAPPNETLSSPVLAVSQPTKSISVETNTPESLELPSTTEAEDVALHSGMQQESESESQISSFPPRTPRRSKNHSPIPEQAKQHSVTDISVKQVFPNDVEHIDLTGEPDSPVKEDVVGIESEPIETAPVSASVIKPRVASVNLPSHMDTDLSPKQCDIPEPPSEEDIAIESSTPTEATVHSQLPSCEAPSTPTRPAVPNHTEMAAFKSHNTYSSPQYSQSPKNEANNNLQTTAAHLPTVPAGSPKFLGLNLNTPPSQVSSSSRAVPLTVRSQSPAFAGKSISQSEVHDTPKLGSFEAPSFGSVAAGTFLASRGSASPLNLRSISPKRGGFVQSAMLKREGSTLLLRSRAGSVNDSPSSQKLDSHNSPFGGSPGSPFPRLASLSSRKGHGRTQSTNSINYGNFPAFAEFPSRSTESMSDSVSTPPHSQHQLHHRFSKLNLEADLSEPTPNLETSEIVVPRKENKVLQDTQATHASKEIKKEEPKEVVEGLKRLRELQRFRDSRLRKEREQKKLELMNRANKVEDPQLDQRASNANHSAYDESHQAIESHDANKPGHFHLHLRDHEEAVREKIEGHSPEVVQEAEELPLQEVSQGAEQVIEESQHQQEPIQEVEEAPCNETLKEVTVSHHASTKETFNPATDGPTLAPPPEMPSTPERSAVRSIHETNLSPKPASIRRWSPVRATRATWLESALKKTPSSPGNHDRNIPGATTAMTAQKPPTVSFTRSKGPMPAPLGSFVKQSSPSKGLNRARPVVDFGGKLREPEVKSDYVPSKPVDLVPRPETKKAAAAAAATVVHSESDSGFTHTPEPTKLTATTIVVEPAEKSTDVVTPTSPPTASAILPKANRGKLFPPNRSPRQRVTSPGTALLLNRASSLRPTVSPRKNTPPVAEALERLRQLRSGTQNRFIPSTQEQSNLARLKAGLKRSSTLQYQANDVVKETILGAKNSLRSSSPTKNLREVSTTVPPSVGVVVGHALPSLPQESLAPELPVEADADLSVSCDQKEEEKCDREMEKHAAEFGTSQLAAENRDEKTIFKEEEVEEEDDAKNSNAILISDRLTPIPMRSPLPTPQSMLQESTSSPEFTTASDSDSTTSEHSSSPLARGQSWTPSPPGSPMKYNCNESTTHVLATPRVLRDSNIFECSGGSSEEDEEESHIVYTPPRSKPKPIRGGGSGIPKVRGHNFNVVGIASQEDDEQDENKTPSSIV